MRRALAILVLGTLAAAGCGPSRDGIAFVRTDHCPPDCDAGPTDAGVDARIDTGPPAIPPEPLEDWDETGAGPLTGIYAVEVVLLATVVVDIEVRQLYRVRIVQRDTATHVGVSPCALDLVDIPGVASLRFSPQAESAIRTRFLEFDGDYLSAADPIGATFAPPPAVVVIGASLAVPDSDPLPTPAEPATATDDDADGNPGVTIDATAVVCRDPEEAYAAFRASLTLSATIGDVDAFDGAAEPALDQSILGYSDPCLSVASSLSIVIRPGSEFHARRVDAEQDLDMNGNVSCPEILWWSPRFFGDYWLR